jgi:hypothetical protein
MYGQPSRLPCNVRSATTALAAALQQPLRNRSDWNASVISISSATTTPLTLGPLLLSRIGFSSARLRSPLIRRGGGGVVRWVGTLASPIRTNRSERTPLHTSRFTHVKQRWEPHRHIVGMTLAVILTPKHHLATHPINSTVLTLVRWVATFLVAPVRFTTENLSPRYVTYEAPSQAPSQEKSQRRQYPFTQLYIPRSHLPLLKRQLEHASRITLK